MRKKYKEISLLRGYVYDLIFPSKQLRVRNLFDFPFVPSFYYTQHENHYVSVGSVFHFTSEICNFMKEEVL